VVQVRLIGMPDVEAALREGAPVDRAWMETAATSCSSADADGTYAELRTT